MENILFDVLIIGASTAGRNLYNHCIKLNKNSLNKKVVGIVSREFTPQFLNKNKADETYKIIGNIVFIEFMHGILKCTLANGKMLCAKRLIIATGLELPDEYKAYANNKKIYFNYAQLEKLPRLSSSRRAVLECLSVDCINAAVAIANKYSSCLICTDLPLDYFMQHKLLRPEQVIQNCTIDTFSIVAGSTDICVHTSQQTTIICNNLLINARKKAATSFILPNLAEKTSEQKLYINDDNSTTILPNLYAIGTCTAGTGQLLANLATNLILEE